MKKELEPEMLIILTLLAMYALGVYHGFIYYHGGGF